MDLNNITILAITLQGITPTFYKIPVTAELSEAVARGRHTLHCSSPIFSVHPRSMATLATRSRETKDRAEILACLEALLQSL
ncbi:hypothetical protein CY34DRAFT_782741 [Suillus luteus UH-Slu-Lm8-n1]|uniref:Uncharacterized protein n=1 Tax=Suillus luteus UH-Slu-Lm8-n1 TaxID=930992 RepID=A0A0D0B3V0_9AGAM|nr:hypothetical protein CY34DRAFT_782741 [Suillus luteus UH-Slu-Lm8-n1]